MFTATANGSATYINPFLLQGLTYRFEGVKEKSNFSAINVVLTDSLNPLEKVTFKVARGGVQGTTVTINNKVYSLSTAFDANASFNISYINGYIEFCSQAKTKIATFDGGKEFTGFTSNYVYFTLEFEGVTSESAVKVSRIWGQNVSVSTLKKAGDERKPVGDFASDLGGSYTVNDVVTIPVCSAFDLLDPNVKATMVVTGPTEEVVSDINGTILMNVAPDKEYQLKLSQEGSYVVLVTITDAAGLKGRVSREISVTKIVEPKIVLGSYSTKYKVGDTIKVASAKAVGEDGKVLLDSDGSVIPVFVYVFDSEGKMNQLQGTEEFNANQGTNKFKAEYSGTYRVCYLVKDVNGSVSYTEYEIIVK